MMTLYFSKITGKYFVNDLSVLIFILHCGLLMKKSLVGLILCLVETNYNNKKNKKNFSDESI